MSALRRYRWQGNEREKQVEALALRLRNPFRHSPRRKPRDPDAFRALALTTLAQIERDERFERLGPRHWRMR